MKILVICGPKLGDVVVRIPVIETLKKYGFEVYVLQESWCDLGKYFLVNYAILKENRIIKLNSKIKLNILKIIFENFHKFDYIFLTTPATIKTIFFSKILFPKKSFLFNKNNYKNIIEGDKIILEQLLKRKLNYKLSDFSYVIKENMLNVSDYIKNITKNKFLCVYPGQWHRSFRKDVWMKLLADFSKKYENIIIIGGNDTLWLSISDKKFKNIIDLRNKISLDETIYIIKKCKIFFTANSGLMWISILLGVKTIAFHGPSKYIWQYNDNNIVNLRFWNYKNCIGYPCEILCIYKDYRCIKFVEAYKIINSIKTHIKIVDPYTQ